MPDGPKYARGVILLLAGRDWSGHFRVVDIKRFERSSGRQDPDGELIGYTLTCLDTPNPGGIYVFFEAELAKLKPQLVQPAGPERPNGAGSC